MVFTTGKGGNINIEAGCLLVADGARAIASDSLNLNEGKITATSTKSGGGEINLTTDSIFLDLQFR